MLKEKWIFSKTKTKKKKSFISDHSKFSLNILPPKNQALNNEPQWPESFSQCLRRWHGGATLKNLSGNRRISDSDLTQRFWVEVWVLWRTLHNINFYGWGPRNSPSIALWPNIEDLNSAAEYKMQPDEYWNHVPLLDEDINVCSTKQAEHLSVF